MGFFRDTNSLHLDALDARTRQRLAGDRKGQPVILDNVSKRNIRPTLKAAGVTLFSSALSRYPGTNGIEK